MEVLVIAVAPVDELRQELPISLVLSIFSLLIMSMFNH